MASLDDLLRQLGIGGVARNRAGQIVTNTNDIVPVATAGLADTLYGAGRGTLAGTAAIGGIPGDINQMYVNKFGALFPNQPAPPTSEQISAAVKRAVPPLNLSRDNTGSVATSLGENVVAPITAPESLLGAARATKGMPVGMSIKEVKPSGLLSDSFNVIKRDASDTFGAGTERIRYIDPKSGGTIEVLSKPDNTASVMSLEVPEQFRGKKIGESLQARVLQDFPEMQGQVSSKAAAKTAYRLGRRPVGEPNATLDDVFKAIEDNSSVNLVSPEMQKRFTGSIKPTGKFINEAHQTASKNAEKMLGLPPGNTAMDRAKALGFTEKGYTGTNRDITVFDPSKAGSSGSGSREGSLGTWLTDDPRVASSFADWSARGQGGNVVYPLMIRGKNPKEFSSYQEIRDLVDANTQFTRPPYRMMQDTINYENAKKSLGDYGVLRNTMTDAIDTPITQYIVPDPSRLRSKYAAFDPARVNEADLLAGVVPLGLIAGKDQLELKKEKKPKK